VPRGPRSWLNRARGCERDGWRCTEESVDLPPAFSTIPCTFAAPQGSPARPVRSSPPPPPGRSRFHSSLYGLRARRESFLGFRGFGRAPARSGTGDGGGAGTPALQEPVFSVAQSDGSLSGRSGNFSRRTTRRPRTKRGIVAREPDDPACRPSSRRRRSSRVPAPAFPCLAPDVGLAGLTLGIERVEILLESLVGRLAGVDRAAPHATLGGRHRGVPSVRRSEGPDQRAPVISRATGG
jgi:hypothetical protein